MNDILRLRGTIEHKKNNSSPGYASLPVNTRVTMAKIKTLLSELEEVKRFWESKKSVFDKVLISVQYISVVAKSNRIVALLSNKGAGANSSVRGARFSSEINPKHIITYCVDMDCLDQSIKMLTQCAVIVDSCINKEITHEHLLLFCKGKMSITLVNGLSKSTFASVIKDCYYAEKFFIPDFSSEHSTDAYQVVSVFDIGLSFEDLCLKVGLQDELFEKLNDTTWLLDSKQYNILRSKAPFLIAMEVSDLNNVNPIDSISQLQNNGFSIPQPTNEPTIGVIDTAFNEDVYFSDWVENHQYLNQSLIKAEDYYHGTAVTSIIVDGPALNPHLEDGCGRFKVRHFGVAYRGRNSSLAIVKRIKEIVESNRDIKVWNLSLGGEIECQFNCISPESAVLDELQFMYDVIFVVAGTNNNNPSLQFPRVASPADSINSIVVNSVSFSNQPAYYSRSGPVLGFFNKPDVSYYGGDKEDGIRVCYPHNSMWKVRGTSFAAPWIARKVAFLICVMNFPREIAKALIIDAACDWMTDLHMQHIIGYGKVPTSIHDVIKSKDDEIKFLIFDESIKYDTYAYNIPVPKSKDKYPFVCKATLCYFPKCSRNQGVDYTDTELDIHFGRLQDNGILKSINNNMQGDPVLIHLSEQEARKQYRKWDNVKHISEGVKELNLPKKAYGNRKEWGFSIKAKERLEERNGHGLHFGLVVTLKEINGKNRIEEFIRLCHANRDWDVHACNIQNMLENYQIADTEVTFDD